MSLLSQGTVTYFAMSVFYDTATLSIMRMTIMAENRLIKTVRLRITILSVSFMMSVTVKSIMMSFSMPSVIMLNVIMLSVAVPYNT
jgi:hypothetical protein